MNPRVSVNICCYNSEKFIKDTLESVLGQTLDNFEVIIIDDGSRDKTAEIIKSFSDSRIKYFYQENRGLSYSRNAAMSVSSGDYIAFIDHDDLWLPEKLEQQVSLLDGDIKANFSYSNYYILDGIEGQKKRAIKIPQPEGEIFEKFLFNYTSGILTVVIRRSALSRLNNFFDENLKLTEDYDFFMRFLYTNKARYIHEPLAVYRIHRDMNTLKLLSRAVGERRYVVNKFNCLHLDFEKRYAKAVKFLNREIEYYDIQLKMMTNDLVSVRRNPGILKSLYLRSILLYFTSFLPVKVWSWVWEITRRARKRKLSKSEWSAILKNG